MPLKKVFLPLILTILLFIVYPFFHITENVTYAANDITNNWSNTLSLPNALASSVATSANGKIYFFGGANNNDSSQIFIPTMNPNGSILNWNNANNSLPQTRYWGSLVQKNNRVYILGGSSLNAPGNFVSTVYTSVIQVDGTLGVWETLASLPQTSALGAAAVVGDRIYYAGGFNPGYSNKVYSAPINPDGSLGAWIDAGNLPAPQIGFSMIEHNGHLIIVGGDSSASVYYTTPDGSGLISGWSSTVSVPNPVYRASAIKIGNTLFVVGGQNGNTTDNIYFTTIHDDGTVDPWTLSANHLPSPVHGGSIALVGDYLYLMGGYNSNSGQYLSSVYFSKLNLAPPETTLNVPLLKQTDPLWGTQLYDSANIWAPANQRGISEWGCALTSAAMVFQYNKIVKLPDNSTLTPGSLNTWLKQQSDGYIGNGLVNWLALSRLSKLAKSKNPDFAYDALEYNRVGGSAKVQLKTDLENNIPGILEEPGHYIVGTGTSGSGFTVNDPFYTRTLLSDYSDTFLSLGRYIPSNTDLSYMMFVVDDGVTLTLKDSNGNGIGSGFTQAPIDQDGGTGKSGPSKFIYLVSKPGDGNYTLTLTSPTTKKYKLQTFLYDKDGNVKMGDTFGIASSNNTDTFVINFNHANKENSKFRQSVSFENLLADLDLLFGQKLVNSAIYATMKSEIIAAQKLSLKNKVSAKAALLSVSLELDKARGKSVSEDAYQILKPEVVALSGSL